MGHFITLFYLNILLYVLSVCLCLRLCTNCVPSWSDPETELTAILAAVWVLEDQPVALIMYPLGRLGRSVEELKTILYIYLYLYFCLWSNTKINYLCYLPGTVLNVYVYLIGCFFGAILLGISCLILQLRKLKHSWYLCPLVDM